MRLHNRQIKATFWTDPDLLQWPREKRWFYLGLVQLADDSGCLENSPFAFKIHLFPSPVDSDITPELLGQWVEEMIAQGKLKPYAVNGKEYLFITNFHKHQTPDYPTPPSKASIPLPPWVQWVEEEDKKRKGRYVVLDYSEDVPPASHGNPRETQVVSQEKPEETPPINITGTVTGNITGTCLELNNPLSFGEGVVDDPPDGGGKTEVLLPAPSNEGEEDEQNDRLSPSRIADLWNEECGDALPRVTKMTEDRRKKVRARLAASAERRREDWWRSYFSAIRASPFLCGDNDRGWRANFDWAIKSETVIARVLEGMYETRRKVPRAFASLMEWVKERGVEH